MPINVELRRPAVGPSNRVFHLQRAPTENNVPYSQAVDVVNFRMGVGGIGGNGSEFRNPPSAF
jgi:hypothetical protein